VAFPLKPNYVELIKGKTHNRFLNTISIITQVALSVIIFIFMSSNITNAGALAKDLGKLSVYENIKDYNYFIIGPSLVEGGANEKFGNFFRKFDEAGKLMFVERNGINLGDLSDDDEREK
jgi:hypothetical protein